jgi:hypothetical protein
VDTREIRIAATQPILIIRPAPAETTGAGHFIFSGILPFEFIQKSRTDDAGWQSHKTVMRLFAIRCKKNAQRE